MAVTGQDRWEDLQGSAVALASLFTFMQKEQQLEGWGVVPEHLGLRSPSKTASATS